MRGVWAVTELLGVMDGDPMMPDENHLMTSMQFDDQVRRMEAQS